MARLAVVLRRARRKVRGQASTALLEATLAFGDVELHAPFPRAVLTST
jgi:hypothetical protein